MSMKQSDFRPRKKYPDGRTKQAFKNETDVNRLLARARRADTLSHIAEHGGQYADFSDFDFLDAQVNLTKGREIFDALPAELRTEFHQSPAAFFDHVNHPDNANAINYNLPALAQPGRQNLDVSGRTPPVIRNPEPEPAPEAPPEPPPQPAQG